MTPSAFTVPVPVPAAPLGAGDENGWITTFIRCRSLSQDAGSAIDATAWLRVVADDVDWSAATTSRVSMLGEASISTAIVGFSSGRNSSIHSGWLSSTATIATMASRSSSSRPIEAR